MEQGYVQVYTGDGKGKTTAALGLALRAAGAGLKVYIGQFIKDGEYSEVTAIKSFLPGAVIEQYGTGFIFEISEADVKAAEKGFDKASEIVLSGGYDVVILDEINVAMDLGLLDNRDVIGLIKKKPQNTELVLTGRNAAPDVVEAADLVSEVMEVKHYYRRGVKARKGIEE